MENSEEDGPSWHSCPFEVTCVPGSVSGFLVLSESPPAAWFQAASACRSPEGLAPFFRGRGLLPQEGKPLPPTSFYLLDYDQIPGLPLLQGNWD